MSCFHSREDVGFPLRDINGRRFATAQFVEGLWTAPDEASANAMRRVIEQTNMRRYAIREVVEAASPPTVPPSAPEAEGPTPEVVTQPESAANESAAPDAIHRRARKPSVQPRGDSET